MKITVTGSLGNISKPLTEILLSKGHQVTVISSDPKKQQAIQSIGATAAIGSLTDLDFLIKTFTGADAVYAMIPLSFQEPDLPAYMKKVAANYLQAIRQTYIKKLVLLSGWAAEFVEGENVEGEFHNLPGVSISILRPTVFYTNFYMSMGLIRGKGLMGKFLALRYSGIGALLKGKTGLLMGNYGGEDRIVLVSPNDIAEAAAEELLANEPTAIRYVGSEEMTCNEAAAIIGTAIGKPWLKWVRISDKQMLQGMKMAKVPLKLAETLVAMQSAMHSGKPLENFHRHHPKMGKIKLKDFAKEFAVAYNSQ